VFDEKAKNLPKNSAKNVLVSQFRIKGKNVDDTKNIIHTKNTSFDNHLFVKTSSKKLEKKLIMRVKNKNPLNVI